MAKKYTRITTPKGTLAYPHLTTPDTKFNVDGEYRTKIEIPTAAAKALLEAIDKEAEAAYAEAVAENKGKKVKRADLPYALNDETDTVTLSPKLKAIAGSKDKKWTQKPALFDAKGHPIKGDIRVGGGTVAKLNLELAPYYTAQVGAGVSLRLKAVQILDLKEYGSGNASSYGFGEEEGFEAKAPETFEEEAPAAATTSTSDGADF